MRLVPHDRVPHALALLNGGNALAATVLVSRGQAEFHIHMMIATATGMGLAVFIGGALMLLIFYSANSGHDEAAARYDPEDHQ